jgi:Carboxylesterase family
MLSHPLDHYGGVYLSLLRPIPLVLSKLLPGVPLAFKFPLAPYAYVYSFKFHVYILGRLTFGQLDELVQFPGSLNNTSEDCLFINVFRPTGLNSTAKLPVLAWIYGGAFVVGASQLYDPTLILKKSIQMVPVPFSYHPMHPPCLRTVLVQGEPIIFVSMNYRLNSFGFLASEELLEAQNRGTATLNAGLHDIQAAFLWIQKYICEFGGDPAKVCVPRLTHIKQMIHILSGHRYFQSLIILSNWSSQHAK